MSDSTFGRGRKFLMKFFCKLKPDDFKSKSVNDDMFLMSFYRSYDEDHRKDNTITLFNHYMEYLVRNDHFTEEEKSNRILELCDNIHNQIFNRSQSDEKSNRPTISTKSSGSRVIKLSKSYVLQVLSDFIKSSAIVMYDNPHDTVDAELDQEFREQATQNIIDNILQDTGKPLPKAVKNEMFNHTNERVSIWHDTENKCREFEEHPILGPALKKIYFMDVSKLRLQKQATITTLSGTDNVNDAFAKLLPVETLTTLWEPNKHELTLTIVDKLPTIVASDLARKKIRSAYICSGSQMIPGGGVEQGVETNETELCCTTTYSIAINQLETFYPLLNTQISFCPQVLRIKDASKANYPELPVDQCDHISVITVGTAYRPKTNLVDQNKYSMDARLWHHTTQYSEPENVIRQYRAMFRTALFFRRHTVVLDDMGIADFWLPAIQTVKLLRQVIREFKNEFDEIIIAVPKEKIRIIFEKYLNKKL